MTETTDDAAERALAALYDALRLYRVGKLTSQNVGVGILPTDLSAIYFAVERQLKP